MKKYFSFAIGFFYICFAEATNITFNVDSFIGRYFIDGGSANVGNKTLNLSTGSHSLSVQYGGSVSFTVNSDGTVTSGNTAVMSHSGSTLTFNNQDVYFNIDQYDYLYGISASSFQIASGTYRIPVGLSVSITIPPSQSVATFTVDSSGDVTLLTGGDLFDADENEIIFNTIRVNFNPGLFLGNYTLTSKSFLQGTVALDLLPSAFYRVVSDTGATLGDVYTNASEFVSFSNSYLKVEDNSLNFYLSRFTVTPPSGYSGVWKIYGHGNSTGAQDVWLIRGGASRFLVNSVTYTYTATSDCTSFGITTAVGTFSFTCNNNSALYFDTLDENIFNSLEYGFSVKRYDGRFSTSIGDYALEVNEQNISLSGTHLSKDTFHEETAFSQGRNSVVLDGEDENGGAFQITKTFWAGQAEVAVVTQGATDTVTLTVEQIIDGTIYTKSIIQQAVSNSTVFTNVPQITDGVVYISTSRNRKTINSKLPKSSIVYL